MRKALWFCLVLVLAVALTAQVRTGNIYGKVVDPDGNALPGVSVTLSGNLSAPVTVVTTAEGTFRFLSLSPGREYSLKAELSGFKTKVEEGIIISLGTTTNLTLAMEVGVVQENITVTAQTPVVDAKKTTIATNLTRDALQSLPTSRDPWSVVQMAPSVMVDRENVAGMESGQQASFVGRGGASVFEGQGNNAWSMDGVVITDPSSLGSPGYYDFDSFEEMSVSVGGSDVTSQTGGVNINLVSRRGGNRISLSGRFMDTDSMFQAHNLSPELIAEGFTATNRVNTIKDYGFNFGFPIVRDKAWFWGSYGVQDLKTYLMTGDSDDSLLKNAAAKINLQLIPENRFEALIYSWKKEKWGRNASPTFPKGYHQQAKYHMGNPIIKIQDEHMFGDNLLLSAQYSKVNAGFQMIPWADENLELLRTQNITTGVFDQSFQYNIYNRPYTNVTVKGNYFNENLLGVSHEIKFGFDYAKKEQGWTWGLGPGNAFLKYNYNTRTVDVTGDGQPDVARDYGVDISRLQVSRGHDDIANLNAFGLFFSDTITKGRLNFILGLRYDVQRPYYRSFSIPGIDASNPVWTNYFGPGVSDAISAILPGLDIPENKPDFRYKTLSPRLGLTWDITGDGKNVAKVFFAKYGDVMSTGFVTQNLYPLGMSGTLNFWTVDDNGNGLIDLNELYWHQSSNYQMYRAFDDAGNFAGNWADGQIARLWSGYDPLNPLQTEASQTTIAADVNSSNTWEGLITYEREILRDFGVAVNLTYRRYDNFQWFRPYNPETGEVWGQDSYYAAGTIPDQIGPYETGEAAGQSYYLRRPGVVDWGYTLLSTQPGRYDEYFGLDLIFTKRLSHRWMFNGSFTWQTQKAHFSEEGFLDINPQNWFDENNLYPIPNPSNYWALNNQTYAAAVGGRSGKINAYVYSPWLLKLSGLYQFPLDINASFTFSAQQGPIIPRSVTIVDYSNPTDERIDVYLESFGRTHLPMVWNMNIRLEKMFRLGDVGKIYLMADIFNVFNRSTILRRYDMQIGEYYVQDGSFVPNATSNLPYEVVSPRVARFGIRFDF